MAQEHRTPVLIIGSGPAGYTAAIYAARANLKPHLVAGLQPGGQLTITTDVENYPGFADVIQGPWLMEQMKAQAEHVGTVMAHDIITAVDFSQRPFVAQGDSGDRYIGDSVIIATGAQARWLGAPGEEALRGFGVSACATCDGFFYRDKAVAVIGGGNTAAEEALFLTNFAQTVYLVHRRDRLRAEKVLQDRLFAHPKITPLWNMRVAEFLSEPTPGGAALRALDLHSTVDDGQRTLAVDGAFIAIGHDPATQLFHGQLAMDDSGYIAVTPGGSQTSVPGVFAAGDVCDHIYRQAVTAAGMGCMAALDAERFLAAQPAQAAAA